MLWLKNTFDSPLIIEDVTTHDKELGISYMSSLKIDEIPETQYPCLSSFSFCTQGWFKW